jgi:asparagine synthase (glutamine-hydrolysing)
MSGIVGVFSRRDAVDPTRVERATKSLTHRGPDGQGHWVSNDRRVTLGHARLSIIDSQCVGIAGGFDLAA